MTTLAQQQQQFAQGGTWGGRFATPDGNHYSIGEGRS